jgi:hypothetical protein
MTNFKLIYFYQDKLFWKEYASVFEKLYPSHIAEHEDHTDFWTREFSIKIELVLANGLLLATDCIRALKNKHIESIRLPT